MSNQKPEWDGHKKKMALKHEVYFSPNYDTLGDMLKTIQDFVYDYGEDATFYSDEWRNTYITTYRDPTVVEIRELELAKEAAKEWRRKEYERLKEEFEQGSES